MNSERLQLWIYKPVPGARVLQVMHEQALGQGLIVASWSREDVDDAKVNGLNQADQVLDAAQDHADAVGEACRFLVQWCTESGTRPLRTMVHRAMPTDGPTDEHAARADFISPNAMVGQLLNHISQQQKVINGSIGAVLAAYERALLMQQNTMAAQQALITSSREELQEIVTAGPASEGEEELTRLKTRALEKLLDIGPDLVRMGTHAAVSHFAQGKAGAPQQPHSPARRVPQSVPSIANAIRRPAVEVPVDADDDPEEDNA